MQGLILCIGMKELDDRFDENFFIWALSFLYPEKTTAPVAVLRAENSVDISFLPQVENAPV